jgi:hypothetical protein
MGAPVSDPTIYRNLAAALQYLTLTRPDITYTVQQVCLHMHDPHEPHLTAAKRILYLQGTLDHGPLRHASTSDLVIYTDTRQSTSGYAVFLSDNLVLWSLKQHNVISRSSAEVECRIVANDVTEVCWLCQLLVELHNPLSWATLVYCDNVNAVYLSTNPVQHQHAKYVEIDLHFFRERVAVRDIRVLHVLTTS